MSIPFFNLAFNPIIETNCNIRSKKLEERYNFIHANLFTRRSRETLHKCVTIILARRQIRNARRYCKEHIVGAIDRLEDHCQLTIPLDEKIQKNRDTLPPVARERGHWPVFSIVADIVNISPGHLSLCLLYLSTTLHDHPAPLSSPRATNVGKGKGQWSDGKEGRGRNIARRETSEQRWIKGVGDEVEWECVVSVPPRALLLSRGPAGETTILSQLLCARRREMGEGRSVVSFLHVLYVFTWSTTRKGGGIPFQLSMILHCGRTMRFRPSTLVFPSTNLYWPASWPRSKLLQLEVFLPRWYFWWRWSLASIRRSILAMFGEVRRDIYILVLRKINIPTFQARQRASNEGIEMFKSWIEWIALRRKVTIMGKGRSKASTVLSGHQIA